MPQESCFVFPLLEVPLLYISPTFDFNERHMNYEKKTKGQQQQQQRWADGLPVGLALKSLQPLFKFYNIAHHRTQGPLPFYYHMDIQIDRFKDSPCYLVHGPISFATSLFSSALFPRVSFKIRSRQERNGPLFPHDLHVIPKQGLWAKVCYNLLHLFIFVYVIKEIVN